jgi:hydroxymethylpyrimidine/phosphomethylpyrimidine kinase
MNEKKVFPAVLTIAGSDSGGGAGIQTDLRTFSAFKVYGCSAITAVTSQNPNEVSRVDVLPPEAVRSQLETVLDAFDVQFAKTGMLANREIIRCVAKIIAERNLFPVVDPVMVSTSGVPLLEESAVSEMKNELLPLAKWLTPNIPEAELLCNQKISSFADLADAAMMIFRQYNCNVVLKGGHLADTETATDIVCYAGELFSLSSPKIAVAGNTAHGTGCTFSAALAAALSCGKDWHQALAESKAFVCGSLAESVMLSQQLCQMYPPQKSYLDRVSIKKL